MKVQLGLKGMSEDSWHDHHRGIGDGVIAAVSVGLFFILVGVVVVTNSNFWSNLQDFFNHFTVANVTNTQTQLPVPAVPAAHTAVYTAAFQFALGMAALQVLILAMRLTLGSRLRRTAETIGNLVFWSGTAYFLNWLSEMKSTLSISQQQQLWFEFWAIILILIGVSIVARGLTVIAGRAVRKSRS